LQRAARRAAEEVEQGNPISDGLARSNQSFPHFVIPVIRAGEQSGRLAEAFALIHEHGRRLQPTLKLVRNTWLYPLVCIVFGWVARAGLLVAFGFGAVAWLFVRDLFLSLTPTVLIVWLLMRTRWSRVIIDHCLLQLPLVRDTIIRFSVALFFATLRLGYDAGGLSVLSAFDLALDTVRNSAVRKDLFKAKRGQSWRIMGVSETLSPNRRSSTTASRALSPPARSAATSVRAWTGSFKAKPSTWKTHSRR
jgi:type IV pilus assembly protein PilC